MERVKQRPAGRKHPPVGLALLSGFFAGGAVIANVVADVMNAAIRGDLRALVGIPVAGALVAYLLRSRVQGEFIPTSPSHMRPVHKD